MSRPARRTKKAAPHKISASHFVGYVEDDESVEAIMKKFQALEEYQTEIGSSKTAASQSSAGEAAESDGQGKEPAVDTLDEDQLNEIFKRTSSYTVALALRNDYNEDDEEFWNEQLGFDEDGMDEYMFFGDDADDDEVPASGRRGGSGGSRKRRETERPVRLVNKIMHYQLADRNGNLFTIKRRVRHVDPSVPTYTKIPSYPLPLSWAHIIKPFGTAKVEPSAFRYLEAPLPTLDKATVKKLGNNYQGIYIDAPIHLGDDPSPPAGSISMKELSTLPIQDLCVNGFLFVWTDKRLVADMLQVAEKWSFRLVENLCWIRLNRDNNMSNVPSPLFNCSKLMLLMFRKMPLHEIEIRHQRSPDCVFDFIKPSSAASDKPSFIYKAIETLLPQAVLSESHKTPTRLLQLWAPKNFERAGWTGVHRSEA